MTEENNTFPISRLLLIISIISFVLMLGGCCSCVGSQKTEYGQEEYYQKFGGGVGYGAKSYTTGGDPTLAIIGGVVSILSLIGSGIATNFEQSKGISKGKKWADPLASMNPEDLEYLLKQTQKNITNISPWASSDEKLKLIKEEARITEILGQSLDYRRKSWEEGLSSLSIEQLEVQVEELELRVNLTQEDNWRQSILTKVIEKRRDELKTTE
jgi:hypothetical protein